MSDSAVRWAMGRQAEPSAKLLLIYLAGHLNGGTGRCDPSIGRLSHVTGLSDRTIQRALNELERAGLVALKRRPQQSTTYELALRDDVEPLPPWIYRQAASADPVTVTPSPDNLSPPVKLTPMPEVVAPTPTLCHPPGDKSDTLTPSSCHPNKEENREENKERESREPELFKTCITEAEIHAEPPERSSKCLSRRGATKPLRPLSVVLPDWMPVRAWNDYMAMRRAKRAIPTARAVELIVEKLDRWRSEGVNIGDVLNRSTESNWTGLFVPRDQTGAHDRPTMAEKFEALGRRQGGSWRPTMAEQLAELQQRQGRSDGRWS